LGSELNHRVIGPSQWGIVLDDKPPTSELLDELSIDYLFVASGAPVDWPAGATPQIVFDSRVRDDRISGEPIVIYKVHGEQYHEPHATTVSRLFPSGRDRSVP
jgi:hypothetical protein